nr:hypothetical protein [uncultured Pseudodesulfovibrio sp.]
MGIPGLGQLCDSSAIATPKIKDACVQQDVALEFIENKRRGKGLVRTLAGPVFLLGFDDGPPTESYEHYINYDLAARA